MSRGEWPHARRSVAAGSRVSTRDRLAGDTSLRSRDRKNASSPPCVGHMSEPRLLFVISDATGETAEKVVRAALLQFTNLPVQLRMYTRVRLEAEMRSIIGRAKQVHALVV